MPPFCIAEDMLASPVAKKAKPHASALPTLGLPPAGPAETGPFMLIVTGAMTGPTPITHPPSSELQSTAAIAARRLFPMKFSFPLGMKFSKHAEAGAARSPEQLPLGGARQRDVQESPGVLVPVVRALLERLSV